MNVENRIYNLPTHVHENHLYFLKQHSKSFKPWSAIIRINAESKSLIMKLGPGNLK